MRAAATTLRLTDQIHDQTGQWPALVGADYVDYQNGSLTFKAPNQAAIQYWNQGGLVTISAHLYNPANPKGGGQRDQGVDLETTARAGRRHAHRDGCRNWTSSPAGLQELKDAGVVVLWRPFHEMNGGWFWWGAKDPDTFIKVWRHMFDYFSKTKGLDNLLWVYSPNHGNKTAAYYAGDDYVDLVGLDAYTDFVDTDHIKGYAEVAKIEKPFRLHRIRSARPAKSARRLRLPAIPGRREAGLSQGGVFHVLGREMEPGQEQ